MPSELRKALKWLGDSAHVVGCCIVSCQAVVTSSSCEKVTSDEGVSTESNVSLGSPGRLTGRYCIGEIMREVTHGVSGKKLSISSSSMTTSLLVTDMSFATKMLWSAVLRVHFPWLKKAVWKVVAEGDDRMWRELLCGDPGAVSVKATCAVLCTVLCVSVSSTEGEERLRWSRESSSAKQVKAKLAARQWKSHCSHLGYKIYPFNKYPLTVNVHHPYLVVKQLIRSQKSLELLSG